jgi:hypothetical protein
MVRESGALPPCYHSAGGRHIGFLFISLICNYPCYTAVCDVVQAIPVENSLLLQKNKYII